MAQEDNDIDGLLDDLVEREGGFVDHPNDRGGATRFGITEAVARAHGYRGGMRYLPREEALSIYRRLYWLRPHFDAVAERAYRIAAELFDTGVNMGPAVAATFLQRALTALNRQGKDFGNYILEKADSMVYRVEDRPVLTDVVLTSAMIEAGVTAFLEAQEPYDRGLDVQPFQTGLQAALAQIPVSVGQTRGSR